MDTPEITAYLKTTCGWSNGVRAVLAKYNLKYTEKDIIQNPAFRWEMETKSGQPLSPCVEINGKMLADISGEEVENYLVENKLVARTTRRHLSRQMRPARRNNTRLRSSCVSNPQGPAQMDRAVPCSMVVVGGEAALSNIVRGAPKAFASRRPIHLSLAQIGS